MVICRLLFMRIICTQAALERVFLKAVLVCEDDSMCGGFTFKGVQLQEDLQHEVIVGMMTMMALVHG